MFFPRASTFSIRQSVNYFEIFDDLMASGVYLASDTDSFPITGSGRPYANDLADTCWELVICAPDYAAIDPERQVKTGFSQLVSR